MPGYKTPDFNDRTAAARDAKLRALEKLKTKPALDPEVVAARQAAQAAREAAAAEKRAARQAEIEEAKAARAAKAQAAIEAAEAAAAEAAAKLLPQKPKLTEAEQKAARDLRYALRKARKK